MADHRGPGARCEARLTKILLAQYKNFTANPHPHLLAVIDERDIRVWYFLAGGLDTPFLHGEYLFRLTAPDEFPQKPPRFEFCTENGVFQPGGPICISVGEFHAGDSPGKDGSHGWRASLGMGGFAVQVVNGLICFDGLDRGIRITSTTGAQKSALALRSRAQNRQHFPDPYALFEAVIASSPDSEPSRNMLRARARRDSLADGALADGSALAGGGAPADGGAPAGGARPLAMLVPSEPRGPV